MSFFDAVKIIGFAVMVAAFAFFAAAKTLEATNVPRAMCMLGLLLYAGAAWLDGRSQRKQRS